MYMSTVVAKNLLSASAGVGSHIALARSEVSGQRSLACSSSNKKLGGKMLSKGLHCKVRLMHFNLVLLI